MHYNLKTLCPCSSSNEVVNAAASPDRQELPTVDSQGSEIVTAGVSHFDLKSALTDRTSYSKLHSMAYYMHDAGPYVRKLFDICKLLA